MAGKPNMQIVGERFGRLVVVAYAGAGKWHCVCDCGNEKTVPSTSALRFKQTNSCGCLLRDNGIKQGKAKKTHGASQTPTLNSFHMMHHRCKSPKNASFPWYGGRGIKVCERWQKFENFLADMGERPLNHTIDRIDPDGDYSPENCRWLEGSEQYSNRRNHNQFTPREKRVVK